MRGFACAVVVLLCVWNVLAQFDEPANPDSLRTDSLTAWPDTTMAFSDTLVPPAHVPWHHGWLYPLGIAVMTCAGFVLLYSTRSR